MKFPISTPSTLREAEIKERMSKIYVDDNHCLIEKLKPGTRFNIEKKKFESRDEWRNEKEMRNREERTIQELKIAMNSVKPDLV